MKARLALLLVTGLLATAAAWTQSGTSGAARVDSREECAALDGKWQPATDGWQAACEVPWSQPECLRLGGFWTPIPKSATGGRCVAGVSEMATAHQCLDHGGSWGPPGARTPRCIFETAKAQVRPKAPDAGKRCDSQKDCVYGCVYEGPAAATGADVLGRCRPDNTAAGCFSMVEAGRLVGSVCRK